MLAEIVALFLGLSLLFYCLFAGADFGAGILELFLGRTYREEQRTLITKAMGPVWEANHVWLILAIVILLEGFPKAFAQLSITFHFPLVLMLIGVVMRGCAFTFRHYDAVKDRSQKYYSAIFVVSSFVTPFLLGVVAGGVMMGRITPGETRFREAYVDPWLNFFPVAVGLFVCALFAFLAAVYLIGETRDPALKDIFRRRAKAANALAVLAGMLVFATSVLDDYPLLSLFLSDKVSLGCMLVSTGLLFPLWRALDRSLVMRSRLLAATQMALILVGWFKIRYPILIAFEGAPELSLNLYNAGAPEATLRALVWALVVGSALIFPSLGYLLRIFKASSSR